MSNNHDLVRSYSYKGRHRREALQMRKAAVAVATVGAAAAAPMMLGGGVAHADSVGPRRALRVDRQLEHSTPATVSRWSAVHPVDLGRLRRHRVRAEVYRPPAQQIAVAQRVLAGQGSGAWPVCSVQAG